MKQGLYRISRNEKIACQTYLMRLDGDTSALVRGGQFVDVSIRGKFLRRPFAVTEWNEKSLSIIYKVIGEGTEAMSKLAAGTDVDLLTGLGNGFDADACKESALIVSGGLGASPLFSLAKELVSKGRRTTAILGFNRADEVILEDEYRSMGADVHVVTLDGSYGMKGLVTDAVNVICPEFDHFYTCGPKVMMKAVCDSLDKPGQASLEERMGCGCGICYGCTCHTKNGPRRVCADGPIFRKEDIIW